MAIYPLSEHAFLVGFLMIWLRCCVIPSLTHDALTVDLVYPDVQIACGMRLALLPRMVANIHCGLQLLAKYFYSQSQQKPGIEMEYTYLMAWFVMHCTVLMDTISRNDIFVPYVQQLRGCE